MAKVNLRPEVFKMTQIRVLPKKGLEIGYSHSYENGPEKNNREVKESDDRIPVKEFSDELRNLRSILIQYQGHDALAVIDKTDTELSAAEAKALKTLEKVIQFELKSKTEDLEISKVTVNYYADQDKRSVQIFANHVHPVSKQRTPVKTGKIALHAEQYGFEFELRAMIDKLNEYAEAYVFDRQSATPELFDGDDGGQPKQAVGG